MQTHADKNQENQRNQLSAVNTRKKEKQNVAPDRFEDHRPQAARIKRRQELANNSPRNQRLAQLQNMVNGHPAEQELSIQKKPDPPDSLTTSKQE
ncbi:MAG: hypothetical protein AAF600_19595 [Bacteroidota bacterium]